MLLGQFLHNPGTAVSFNLRAVTRTLSKVYDFSVSRSARSVNASIISMAGIRVALVILHYPSLTLAARVSVESDEKIQSWFLESARSLP